jgi:putative AlgH/UPF0301 family transcriptional regulator
LQIAAGSLLVAHPRFATHDLANTVVFVTESSEYSTMGLMLNRSEGHSMQSLMQARGSDWPWNQPVYIGGDYNPTALVMLHTDEWYSSNTMQTGRGWAISSDEHMIDKLEMGDFPEWHRLFLGCLGWRPHVLEHQLKIRKPQWLLLSRPSWETVTADPGDVWQKSIHECSQKTIDAYI